MQRRALNVSPGARHAPGLPRPSFTPSRASRAFDLLGYVGGNLSRELAHCFRSGPAAIRFLSYFTDLSNVLVALAMTLPWLAPNTGLGRFFTRLSVRTAILAYIIIVAVIYHYLLAKLWNPQGWQLVADTIEHVVAPALYVVDWALFVPKGTLRVKSAFVSLVFPLGYAAYSLVHGAATGFYPYPFIDVSHLGYDKVLTNMAMLILVFGGLGLLLIALDRWLGCVRPDATASS
jgi:hypothetical protein